MNAEVSGPRGLLHRVGRTELVSTGMINVRGIKSSSKKIDDLEWEVLEHEDWHAIRDRGVANAAAAVLVKIGQAKLNPQDVDELITAFLGVPALQNFCKELKTTRTHSVLSRSIALAHRKLSPEVFIESMMVLNASIRDGLGLDSVILAHAIEVWREKARLTELSALEVKNDELVVKSIFG